MTEFVSKRKKLNQMLIFIAIAAIGILFLAPFFWMIAIAFERYSNINPPFPPSFSIEEFSFFNFDVVTQNGAIFTAYKNSMIIAVCSVALNLVAVLTGGYAFSKFQFKGKKVLFFLILATMMVPFETRVIPMFTMFNNWGMINTFLPLILPSMIDGFGLLMAKQFFDKLPDSLGEAATIDGASPYKVFTAIFLPLAMPIIATIIILKFMDSWNSFLWPLVVLTGEEMRTIPIFISAFSSSTGTRLAGSTMMVAFLGIIPVVIVFLLLQKYIIQSVALSGVKGE